MPITGVAYKILFPLRGGIPNPETYGKNKLDKYFQEANVDNSSAADDVRDDIDLGGGRLSPDYDNTSNSAVNGDDLASIAGVGVLGLAVAATAAGLSSSSAKKVASLEAKSSRKIAAIDSKAMQEISQIYKENGISMTQPEVTETKIGVLSVPLAVTGASAAAVTANMNPNEVSRISAIETAAIGDIGNVDEGVGDEMEKFYSKEGLTFTRPDPEGTFLGAAALGAVVAPSLSKSSQAKVGSVLQQARSEIDEVDAKAVIDVESIYQENNLEMKQDSKTSTKIGLLTASIGVLGAGAMASKTKMGSLDIGRIMNIEKKTNEDFKNIDKYAEDKIATIHEKEGVWFNRPKGSRAAAAAASAGLSLSVVKKIELIEKSAEDQIDSTDKSAAKEVTEANKRHSIHMSSLAKKRMTMAFWDAEEESAMTRYALIEEKALDDIASIDRKAEREVSALYKSNGKLFETSKSGGDFFTHRGEIGATSTAIAIKAAKTMALQRRENFRKRSKSLVKDNGMLHLAAYDLGAGVASAGKAISGIDLEGPTEYDVRRYWTPEEKARGCCA